MGFIAILILAIFGHICLYRFNNKFKTEHAKKFAFKFSFILILLTVISGYLTFFDKI